MTGTLTIKTADFGTQLVLYRNDNVANAGITFKNKDNLLGYFMQCNKDEAFRRYDAAISTYYWIFDTSNYTDYVYSKTQSDNRYVNVTGDTMTGVLYINLDSDVSSSGSSGSLIIGNKSSGNIGIDGNEIMARSGNSAATLYLQNEGGYLDIRGTTDIYAKLSIHTSGWNNQLHINRTSSSGSWGPALSFDYDGSCNGTLTMASNELYIGNDGGARYKALHEGNTYISSNRGYINGTVISRVANADSADSAYTLSSWAESSGNEYRYVWHSWSDNTAKVAYKGSFMFCPNTGDLKVTSLNANNSSGYTKIYPGYIQIRKNTAANPTANYASIEFTYNGSTDGQAVYLGYTPNDSYRVSKGLKVFGSSDDDSNVWFETQGQMYAGGGYKVLHSGNSSVSKSGSTLTVKINDTSYSLTDTNDLVNQSQTSTSYYRGLVYGYNASTYNNSALYGNVTNVVYTSNTISARSDRGSLYIAGNIAIGANPDDYYSSYKLYVNGNHYVNGILYFAGSRFDTLGGSNSGIGSIHLNNSDITGVNAISTSDLSDSWMESLAFKRSNGNWDTFRAADGTFYFGINNGTEYVGFHSGNYTSYVYSKSQADDRFVNAAGDTMTGALYINLDSDVSSTGSSGSLIIGNKTGGSIGIDGNEIMARSGNSAATLYLQNEGGNLDIRGTTDIYAKVSIHTSGWSNQLHINRTSSSGTWGPALSFDYDGTCNGTLTMVSNNLYIGDNGSSRYKALHTGNTYVSSNRGYIDGTVISRVANADAADSAYTLSSWAEGGGGDYRYIWMSHSDNTNKVAYSSQLMINLSTATLRILSGNDQTLISPGVIHVRKTTNNTMSSSTTNPRIIFSENGSQAVGLIYTDYDSYRASKGLKVGDVDGSDAGNVWFEVQGNCYAAHFYETSDIRFKTKFERLNISTKSIASLPIFNFSWKNDLSAHNSGTSAQEVQKILPNVVSGTDKLTLDYGVLGTIAGITAAREIEKLKDRIKFLEDKLGIPHAE